MATASELKPKTEILVVDDEQSIREVLRLKLGDEGYDVDIAENGRQALEKLSAKPYDLVITDIRMPGVSGMELLRHVRAQLPDTDVIMMTGYASMESAIETMREGAVDYIIKPFNMDDMVFVIERTLKKRDLEETSSLLDFGRKVFSTIDFEQLLKIILDATFKMIKPDDVSLMLLNGSGELYIAISYGLSPDIVSSTRVKMGKQIAGRVAQMRQPLILNGPIPAEMGFEETVARPNISSAIVFPLVWNDRLLGVLNLSRTRQKEAFNHRQLTKLNIYASLLCQALENTELHARTKALVQELTNTKEELTTARDELENKVRERTQELTVAKTNLEHYSKSLEQRTYEISTLYHLSLKIINTQDFDTLVRTADEIAHSLLRYDLLLHCLFYEDRKEAWLVTSQPMSGAAEKALQETVLSRLWDARGKEIDPREFSVHWVRTFQTGDARAEADDETGTAPQFRLESVMSRLYLHGRQTGYLLLYRTNGPAFNEQERNLFSMIATNMSLAIGNIYSIRKLQETDRIRSEFVSTVSHELKTPLTCIGQSIGMLGKGLIGEISEEQKECLGIASEEVARLERLIKNLLDISKMEAGKLELDLRPVAVAPLVQKAALVLSTRLQDKGIELVQQVAPLSVMADADALLQVLLNLLDNALKFTPRKGRITLRIAPRDEKTAHFAVQDTGPGISEQNRKLLFEKFVQIVGNQNRPTGGSGLGLFICRRLVQLHKGEIGVESQPGQGSTFFFTVPLAES